MRDLVIILCLVAVVAAVLCRDDIAAWFNKDDKGKD